MLFRNCEARLGRIGWRSLELWLKFIFCIQKSRFSGHGMAQSHGYIYLYIEVFGGLEKGRLVWRVRLMSGA